MASASTYLSKTFSTGDNRKKWTWSAWIKRSNLGSDNWLFHAWVNSSNENSIFFDSSDRLAFSIYEGATNNNGRLTTTRKFRDTSAWFHIQCVWDSANATATDRMIIYVNGERETSFDTQINATLNYDSLINSNNAHYIGQYGDGTSSMRFSGCMTHSHFIDGTAYDASAFGETDATTGIWKPKTAPSVTYGTNGFFLKFENSGSMGLDSSGNANNFTVNGTLTQTVDTPSNVFATFNPLDNVGSYTFANGNTQTTTNSANRNYASSTLGMSIGKWYMEIKCNTGSGFDPRVGIFDINDREMTASNGLGTKANEWSYEASGSYRNNSTTTSYGNTYASGDIIGIALDLDNNALYFSKNGTFQNSGDPTSGATKTGAISITANTLYGFAVGDGSGAGYIDGLVNFGNGYFGTTAVSSATTDESGLGIFEYTVPSGYYALCTKNINEQG